MNKPDHGVAAIQRLAFGGIANPTQRAVLRGSDATYLTARQRELDAFEEQRQSYNTALQDFQTNVYEPYKAKSAAYNTAAEKYNTDVYNPYKTQFDAYTKAVEEYNAGPRTADYAGPAAPTLASEFTMTAPTSPTAFAKEAPVLPFEVTDVETHQKAAAKRAVQDASDRAVAIDAVSDPGRFNFGSMSVSNRFMAEGGEVEDDLKGKTARSIVKDFKDYGYSKEEIEQMANEVLAAGRGGDELLAYLSPESVKLLKANGGSGSLNPITGLPEFKGGFIGGIVDKLSDAFSDLFGNKGQPAPAAPAPVPVAPAPAPAPSGPTAAELAAQLEAANKKYADDMAATREQQAAAQKLAIENALKADAEARAKAALPMSKVIAASQDGGGADMQVIVFGPDGKMYGSPREAREAGVTNYTMERPKAPVAAPSTGAVAKPTDPYTIPPSLKTVGAGPVIPSLDLKRKLDPSPPSRYFDRPVEDPNKSPYTPIVNRPGDTGPTAPYNPISQPLPYQTKGVGAIGSVGPASSFFDQPASDPNNFFATTPQTSTGLAPGTAAIGPADMPLYGAKNTMSALGANPNLSPGMLGGQQNAGYRTDRLGNRIYAPGAMPLYGFAKGGDIDLQALLAQNTETLSDDTSEEVINTDPLGTAQKMMADFSSVSQTNPNVSPVRKAIKRTKPEPAKSGSAKMAYESLVKGDLGAMGTSPPKLQDTDSAQAQMRELARIYQLKAQASQDRARGLSADTFGAPTLGQPTLTKGKLTKKRFKDGGEAKKLEGSPEEGKTSIKDQLIGAGETALTLGSGALSSVVGMPYGLYKGLTSGKYLEGKAPAIAEKEAQAFIERNTYVPRSTKGRENLEEINRLMEQSKLPPILPETAMLRSIPRAAVAAQGERIGMATEKALEKPVTEVLKRGGKSAEMLKALSAPPSYAVRPTGSTMLTGSVGFEKGVGEIDKIVQSGISNGRWADQADLIKDFWDKKARNYFTRQFGTPDDPIARGISNKTIKGSVLEEMFPEYMVDQIAVGKTRYKEGMTPEGFVGPGAPVKDRFFPKYPRAMEDLTKRYDEATGLKGNLITTDPAAADPHYNFLSTAGRDMARSSSELEVDKMVGQGLDPRLINNEVGAVTRSIKDPNNFASDGTSSAKDLYKAFESTSLYNKLTPEQKTAFIKDMSRDQSTDLVGHPGENAIDANMSNADVSKGLLSENLRTAIEKGEPIYDIGHMRKPLAELFRPQSINAYLTSLSSRELANVRFEDAVRGGLKLRERTAQFDNMTERIRAGKPVPDKVFSDGVSKPLLQFDKNSSLEGLDGFAWKRIEKREATVPEGAYVGHSVGGYELGGPGYTKEKMEGFKTGKYRVYTLRDNRNKPVNTIEVTMEDANTPIVTQIKGNGRATGNVPAAKYDGAILSFLSTYLKPFAISEKDEFLTPLLQSYKAEIDLRNKAR